MSGIGFLIAITVIAVVIFGPVIYFRVKARKNQPFGRPIYEDKGGYNPPPQPGEAVHRPEPPYALYPGASPTFAPRRAHAPPVAPILPQASSYADLRARQDMLAEQDADLARRRMLLAQQQDDAFTAGIVVAEIIADELSAAQPSYDPDPVYVDPNVDPFAGGGGSFGGGGSSADWVDPTPQPDPTPVYEAPQPTYDPPAYDPPSYDPPDTSSYSSDS